MAVPIGSEVDPRIRLFVQMVHQLVISAGTDFGLDSWLFFVLRMKKR